MKASQFINIVQTYNMEQDEVSEIVKFFTSSIEPYGKNDRNPAVCGFCSLRGTNHCPYPDKSNPSMQACLDFHRKTVE